MQKEAGRGAQPTTDDQGITGRTADEIQTGVALMIELGQFGAGGRALYDPRLGERSLWDWSGVSPCRPRADSPSRPARGTLEGAASPTSSRPAARTSSGSTRTPRSSGSPPSRWNSGAPRRGHRRRGRRPRLPRPCGTYQPSRPEGRGGGHRGSGHGSRAMAHPASITQDAPTSASRSGRPGSGLPDSRAAGQAGEIGDAPLAGLSSVSTTGA